MKYLCLLFLILSLKISAQTEIKGFVFSESKHPVIKANVIFMDSQGSISTFVFSNEDGSFLLNTDKFGDFTLQFSAMGYVKKSMAISFIKKGNIIDHSYDLIFELLTKEKKEEIY